MPPETIAADSVSLKTIFNLMDLVERRVLLIYKRRPLTFF